MRIQWLWFGSQLRGAVGVGHSTQRGGQGAAPVRQRGAGHCCPRSFAHLLGCPGVVCTARCSVKQSRDQAPPPTPPHTTLQRQREADAGAAGHQEGRLPGRVGRGGAPTPFLKCCTATRWWPSASVPATHLLNARSGSGLPCHLHKTTTTKCSATCVAPPPSPRLQSKGSSSLKADELLDLLKADISLDDVPQSGEPDEAVRYNCLLVLL